MDTQDKAQTFTASSSSSSLEELWKQIHGLAFHQSLKPSFTNCSVQLHDASEMFHYTAMKMMCLQYKPLQGHEAQCPTLSRSPSQSVLSSQQTSAKKRRRDMADWEDICSRCDNCPFPSMLCVFPDQSSLMSKDHLHVCGMMGNLSAFPPRSPWTWSCSSAGGLSCITSHGPSPGLSTHTLHTAPTPSNENEHSREHIYHLAILRLHFQPVPFLLGYWNKVSSLSPEGHPHWSSSVSQWSKCLEIP